jgi:hypothetical protein
LYSASLPYALKSGACDEGLLVDLFICCVRVI